MKIHHHRAEFESLYAEIVPRTGYGKFICALASRYQVIYRKSVGDKLADQITRLAGDDVKLDDVEKLLVALDRAGYVPPGKFVPLQVGYLREKFGQREQFGI